MIGHPETGLHYVHVIPDADDYIEIRRRYIDLVPWMRTMTTAEFLAQPQLVQDPRTFFIVWAQFLVPPRAARKSIVTTVYYEAVGPTSNMLVEHAAVLADLSVCGFDAAFAHTPWMASYLGKILPSYVLPLGWRAEAWGSPDLDRAKTIDLAYYGSHAGKRKWAIKPLQQALNGRREAGFKDVSGLHDSALVQQLSAARAILYLAHSDVISFSTWRTWHALAAGTPIVGEVADCWPLVPWTHFVPIPRVTRENVAQVANEIMWTFDNIDLRSVARRSFGDLAEQYAVERCVNDYLVPASIRIQERVQ